MAAGVCRADGGGAPRARSEGRWRGAVLACRPAAERSLCRRLRLGRETATVPRLVRLPEPAWAPSRWVDLGLIPEVWELPLPPACRGAAFPPPAARSASPAL